VRRLDASELRPPHGGRDSREWRCWKTRGRPCHRYRSPVPNASACGRSGACVGMALARVCVSVCRPRPREGTSRTGCGCANPRRRVRKGARTRVKNATAPAGWRARAQCTRRPAQRRESEREGKRERAVGAAQPMFVVVVVAPARPVRTGRGEWIRR
jgi:hypothetical protein